MNLLHTKLNLITENGLTKTQSVNVYNTPCHQQKRPSSNQSTQTTPVSLPTVFSHTKEDWSKDGDGTEDSVEVVLTCTLCNNSFQSSRQLDDHFQRSHSNDCSAQAKVNNNIVSTGFTSHNTTDSSHSCEFCAQIFTTKQALQAHVNTKHPAEYLPCNNCKLRFRTRTQLDTHTPAHHQSSSASASSMTSTITSSVSGSTSTVSEML